MMMMIKMTVDIVSLETAEETQVSTYDSMNLCLPFPGIRIGLSHRHNMLLTADNRVVAPYPIPQDSFILALPFIMLCLEYNQFHSLKG